METTSFIEELDVRTLLTTETSFQQPNPHEVSGSCRGTHRIIIEDECEFNTVGDADSEREIVSNVKGTFRYFHGYNSVTATNSRKNFRAVRADLQDEIPI